MATESAGSGLESGIKNFIGNIMNKEGQNINLEEGLAKVQGAIPQETKDYLIEAQGRILNPKYIRPPKEFFGIGEERPYFFEKEKALVYERAGKNLRYFYLNYGLLATLFFCFSLVFGSGVIVHAVALAAAWFIVIKATEKGSFEYKGFSVTQKEATIVMAIISFFVLLGVLKDAFWGAFGTSCFLIGAHAILRNSDTFVLEEGEPFSIPGVGEATSLLSK